MSAFQSFSDGSFRSIVLESRCPVVVEFSASWCQPCRVLTPILEQLSTELPMVLFGKLDIEQNIRTPEAYAVMMLPTVLLFENGHVKAQLTMTKTKEDLKNEIKEAIYGQK